MDTGIVMNDASFIFQLDSTSIPITLTKDWAKYLKQMGLKGGM